MLHERRPAQRDVAPEPLQEEEKVKSGWRRVARLSTGGGFQYNPRVLLCYAPCLYILLAFGGHVTMVTIALGLMAGFVTDLFNFTQATFLIGWATVALVEVGLLGRGTLLLKTSLVNVFLLGQIAVFCLLIGCWMSLQFKWLKKSSSNSMALIERVLFALSPLVLSSIMTYAYIAYSGFENAAVFFLAVQAIYYYFFIVPVPSSYHQTKSGPASYVCGRAEALANSTAMITIPPMIHIASFARTVYHTEHLVTIIMLVSTAIFILRLFSKKESLWWTGFAPHELRKVELVMLITSSMLLVGCFEYRVIFQTFYYSIPLPVPLNYLFVTLALYCGVICTLLVLMGNAAVIGRPLLMIFAGTAAYAGAYALGINPLVGLLPLLGAVMLIQFLFSRNIRDYIIFVLSSTLGLAWFMRKSFLFLSFHFDSLDVSIQQVSILLLVMYMLAAFIPGMIYSKNASLAMASGAIVAGFSFFLGFIETLLFLEPSGMYPWFLILFTSVIGWMLIDHLVAERAITPGSAWLAASVFAGKAFVLLAPGFGAFFAGIIVMLAFYSIFIFYPDGRVTNEQGASHAVAFFLAALVVRLAIAPALLDVLLDGEPSQLVLLSSVFLVWGVGMLVLMYKAFAHVAAVRTMSYASLFIAMCLVLAEPEMGFFTAVSSAYLWTFLVVALLSLVCPVSDSTPLRLAYCLICGTLIGFSLTLNMEPPSLLSYALLPTSLSLGFVFVIFTMKPTPGMARLLPWIFMLAQLALVAAVLLQPLFNRLAVAHVGRAAVRAKVVLRAMNNAVICVGFFFNTLSALIVKTKLISGEENTGRTSRLDWAPLVGNTAALLSFVIAIWLQTRFSTNSAAILFATPLLLLLNKDAYLLRSLTEQRRYPLLLGLGSLALLTVGLQSLSLIFWMGVLNARPGLLLSLAMDAGLFVCPLPSHILFAHFLWTFEKQSQKIWLMVLPLNFLAFFSSASTASTFALTGFLMCLVQFYMARNIQSYGKKNII